jgi:hypothetical protein
LSSKSGSIAEGSNHCGPRRDQFGRDHGQAVNLPVGMPKIQLDIVAIDISERL